MITVIDEYHQALIHEDVARFYPFGLPEDEATAEENVPETKVVRRGRPRAPRATENVETK